MFASDRASPDAPQRHRPPGPPKLGSRDKRALHEQRPAEPAAATSREGRLQQLELWFEMDVDMEGVPHGAPSGAHRAGPSSDTSEDGWECNGWRREYMDAKFGGEDADMVEIVGGW